MGKYEAGTITIFGDDFAGGEHTVATLQCVHCGGHWVPKPGSGEKRGFCTNCAGYVCGPGCEACVHVEQMLENMERGVEITFKPTVISIPHNYGDWSV